MQPLLSSLSAGDCPVHRLRRKFLTGAQDGHLQTVTITEAAYIQLRRRPPDDEQGNARNMYRILINVLYVNTREWRKLHNEELNDLYSLPNIVRVVKSKRIRWAGHVARMGEDRGVHRVLVGKPEGKRPLGRPRRTWEDNI
jgi:hypothetical protein